MKWTYILFTLMFAFTPKPAQAGIWDNIKNYAHQTRESWLGKKIAENKKTSCAALLSGISAASYVWPKKTPAYKLVKIKDDLYLEIIKKEKQELYSMSKKLNSAWIYPWLCYSAQETEIRSYKGQRYSIIYDLQKHPEAIKAQIIYTDPYNNNVQQYVNLCLDEYGATAEYLRPTLGASL